MSKPIESVAREVADHQAREAVRAGQSVSGADWRLARVSVVYTGTVEIEGAPGIRVRRLSTYTSPAIGDVIAVLINSAGNWLALGRTATGA
ncbi:hypothetical protein [Streptomyces tendae]|uniref:Uncharacterized protein n=1 Tax=Streptomyces tendae TaxID=1932 RepID=A0ABX5ZW17_STRTE|nr:hypothetical protein [Streptomyces tendae]QER88603.1 hypothetical protein F3L20_24570 [Streptomyces tendae]